MVTSLFILFVVLLAMAVPIFVVLSFSTLAAFWMHSPIPLETIVQRLFAGLDKFALMAIPFFIVAANVMSAGGMSRRIIAVANVLVGPFPGGLAMATVVACMFFGAISGSSPATVVAMGSLLYPALVRGGYDKSFAIALVVASGSIALIIPPSITMIVYGAVTGASVGALFVSGFGAGAAYGLGFMGYSYYYAKRHKIPSLPWPTWAEVRATLGDAKWGLGMPILIIGGIYGGIFTPTEAAAVAAVYAIVVALFIYREIGFREFWDVVIQSAGSTAQVMILLAGASVFAYILTSERVTIVLTEAIVAWGASQFTVLILINIALLIAGMLIDGASIILILGTPPLARGPEGGRGLAPPRDHHGGQHGHRDVHAAVRSEPVRGGHGGRRVDHGQDDSADPALHLGQPDPAPHRDLRPAGQPVAAETDLRRSLNPHGNHKSHRRLRACGAFSLLSPATCPHQIFHERYH